MEKFSSHYLDSSLLLSLSLAIVFYIFFLAKCGSRQEFVMWGAKNWGPQEDVD